MKFGILQYMSAQKLLLLFLTSAFLVFGDALAAEQEVVVFTAPHRCPPCQQYEPTINQLVRDGYPITVINVDAPKNQHERDLLAAMEATGSFNSIPTTTIFNIGANGKPAGLIDRIDGEATKEDLVGKSGLLTQNNIGNQAPVVQTPKPQPTNIPKPIPVPPDQIPDKAFINPLKCTQKTINSYVCEYTDSKGVKHVMTVTDTSAKDDFFDAIKDAIKKGVPLMTTDTGMTRPFPMPRPKPSELPDELPPVPGDPGYVPPKPPKGNEGWIPIPAPTGKPIAALNGRGCIVTFPGMVPIEIAGQDIDDFYSRSNAVQGDRSRCEVAMILAAQKNMVPIPKTPAGEKPAVPTPPKYKLEEPQPHKTLAGFWVIKGQMCTDKTCTPFTLTVPADNAEAAKKAVEAQLGKTPPPAATPPQSYKRGATVTPNAPPPGGAVKDPFEVPNSKDDIYREKLEREVQEMKAKNADLDKRINDALKKIEGKK